MGPLTKEEHARLENMCEARGAGRWNFVSADLANGYGHLLEVAYPSPTRGSRFVTEREDLVLAATAVNAAPRLLAERAFHLRLFKFLREVDSVDDVFIDAFDGRLRVYANCNDLFEWGTADCEEITPENVGLLEAAWADLKPAREAWAKHDIGSGAPEPPFVYGAHALLLFCVRVRQLRPQGACYRRMPPPLAALVDAAAPDLPTDTKRRAYEPRTPPPLTPKEERDRAETALCLAESAFCAAREAEERLRAVVKLIDEKVANCGCVGFCETFGCSSLREIRAVAAPKVAP